MRLVDVPWVGGRTVTIDADRIVAIYEGGWMSSVPPRHGSADKYAYTTPDGWTQISEAHAAREYSCTIDLAGAAPVVVTRSRKEIVKLCALDPARDGDVIESVPSIEAARGLLVCGIGGNPEHGGDVRDRMFTRRDGSTGYIRACHDCWDQITKGRS